MDKGYTLSETQGLKSRGDELTAAPRLIVAMECARPLRAPSSHSLAGLDRVVVGRGEPRSFERYEREGRRELRICIPSPQMSSTHFEIYPGADGWMLQDAGSKNQTFIAGRATRLQRLSAQGAGGLIEAGRTIFLFRSGAPLVPDGPDDVDLDEAPQLTTLSPALHREYHRLSRIAPSLLPVVILGETGTGKEVAARAVHQLSGRSGRFVAVNCGALAESLVESLLFGHKKGSFSGATEDRPGLFRSADGGTIFLDEIAELPASSQVALLRVLQEGEVRPVGGTEIARVDVRVLAATLRDLPSRVAAGEFREDLYARLSGLTVELPPLRERPEDIGLLCGALLRKLARTGRVRAHLDAVRIDRAAARALFGYTWPLNVRELEHALAAALALADNDEITLDNLPGPIRAAATADQPVAAPSHNPDNTLHGQLIGLLVQHQGNVSAVARTMGKAPMQIYRWLKRFGIDIDEFRR